MCNFRYYVLVTFTLWLGGLDAQAANFFPTNPAQLIADINVANINGADDTIFLSGLTFTLTSVNNDDNNEGLNGLPSILPDSGHSLTIQGGIIERDVTQTGFRLIRVAPTGTLFLNSVTLQNGLANDDNINDFPGNGGGALLNDGTLSLTNCQVLNNTSSSATIFGDAGGGAIYNAGGTITTIFNCLFNNNISAQDFGGAIINNLDIATGTILGIIQTIDSSTFSNNQAFNGGGAIGNFGTIVTIKNSTFSDNTAGSGGAIFQSISTSTTIASIQNSTFSGNRAIGGTIAQPVTPNGGAIDNELSIITQITNSTFNNNSALGSGGGLYNSGTITLQNTIIANSTGGDCGGTTITAGSDSMADDNTCGGATQVASGALNLGPLQNNGGPTQTIALLPGSVAIAAGNVSYAMDTIPPLVYDQRGSPYSRYNNNTVDVGAYEAQAQLLKSFSPSIITTTETSMLTITLNFFDAGGTIALTDTLPNGLLFTGTGTSSCGGSINFNTPTNTTLSFSGGVIPSTGPDIGSCTITATVQSSTLGVFKNTIHAGELEINGSPTAFTASAYLLVRNPCMFSLAKF